MTIDLFKLLSPMLNLLFFVAVGWIVGKKGHNGDALAKGLVFLIMRATLPALVIMSMQRSPTPELLRQGLETFLLSLGFYLGVGLLAAFIAPRLPLSRPNRGLFQFVALFGNVGFMGFPVIEALYGKESLFFVAIFNLPFNFIIFSYGVHILRSSRSNEGVSEGLPWKEVLLAPIMLSLFLAVALFLTGTRLPPLIALPLDLLGGITSPLSMVTIGIILSRVPIGKALGVPTLWLFTLVRLVLVPLLVLGALWVLPVSLASARTALLLAAMPAAANTPILALEYRGSAENEGYLVLLTSLAVFFTLPIFIVFGSVLFPGFI